MAEDYKAFPIVGEYNVQRSLENDAQDLINMYVVKGADGQPDTFAYMPGVNLLSTLQNSINPIRPNGIYVPVPIAGNTALQSSYFVVISNSVYRIDTTGTQYFLGNINSTIGNIYWSNNTTQIMILDGQALWYYTVGGTNTITQVTFGDGFPITPQMIYYQDARFFLTFMGSNQIFFSNQGDGTTWSSINEFALESRPDLTQGICGINERVFIFGTLSTEIWEPTTYPQDNPLVRDPNFIFEFGCLAQGSIIKGVLDTKKGDPFISFIYWLTSHIEGVGSFVLSVGGTPMKVSSEAIDLILRNLDNPSDCVSICYKDAGHTFIENTFISDQITLVYDLTTQMWFRKVYNNSTNSIINSHIYFQGNQIVGSTLGPYLYTLSDSYLTDNGVPIVRSRTTQTYFDPGGKRIRVDYFEVMFESGFVDITPINPQGVTPGIAPTAFLSISFDGGVTYGNPRQATMGQIGQYRWRTWWEGLGVDYNFTFKITVYAPVRVYMFGGIIKSQVLAK